MPSAGLGGAGPRVRSSVGPCFGLGQHLDTGRPGLPAGGAGGAGLGRRRETNQSGPSRPRLRHDDHCMIFTAMMIVATVAGFQSRSRPACNPLTFPYQKVSQSRSRPASNPLTFPIQMVKLRVKRKVCTPSVSVIQFKWRFRSTGNSDSAICQTCLTSKIY